MIYGLLNIGEITTIFLKDMDFKISVPWHHNKFEGSTKKFWWYETNFDCMRPISNETWTLNYCCLFYNKLARTSKYWSHDISVNENHELKLIDGIPK